MDADYYNVPSPETLRNPAWLQSVCSKIASGLKRPPAVDHEDVMGDAAVVVLQIAHGYASQRSKGLECGFLPWLIVSVRGDLRNKYAKDWDWANGRVACDEFVDDPAWMETLVPDDALDTEKQVLDKATLDYLAEKLGPKQMETYRLAASGLNVKQIAETLGVPYGTAEARLVRAKKVMRERLKDIPGETL